MDPQQFDRLAKRLARSSRRAVLGSLLGGIVAAVGLHEGDAATKRHKQRHEKTRDKRRRDRKHSDPKRRNKKQPNEDVSVAAAPAKKCGGKLCGAGNTCLTGGPKPVCCPNARMCGNKCLANACTAPCKRCDSATGACDNAT